MVRWNAGKKSALGGLFLDGAALLGQGLRGPELAAQFRSGFDGDAEACLGELNGMVAGSLRHLGLWTWPGGRLGWDYKQFGRLGDEDAVEALGLALLVGDDDSGGLGWLGGALFRGGRLLGYLQAAEQDVEKALAILRRNMGREIQRLRDAADPLGAALFANVKAGGLDLGTGLFADGLLVSRLAGVRASDDSAELHGALISERGVLEAFREVAVRNENRDEGTRNSPIRGAKFEAPLVEHFAGWRASAPANPDCETVHLGHLANCLRDSFPPPESLREGGMVMDSEGRTVVEAVAAPVAALDLTGPDALVAWFEAWEVAVEMAPGLGEKRGTKLALILKEVRCCFLDALGAPVGDWLGDVRRGLGIKSQTFSDDWKLLRDLCPGGLGA